MQHFGLEVVSTWALGPGSDTGVLSACWKRVGPPCRRPASDRKEGLSVVVWFMSLAVAAWTSEVAKTRASVPFVLE